MDKSTYTWDSYQHDIPDWFRDAKFGLFFHWGPYSVPAHGGEWYSRNIYDRGHEQNRYHVKTYGKVNEFGYKDLIPLFKAEKFDPRVWAELVKLSGARYAGPVSEHADNFSLWDSQVNPVNAYRMGPRRDVVGECFEEFRKRGIRCIATFHHQWLWGWYMGTETESDVYDPANEMYYGQILPLETNRYIPYQWPNDRFNIMWRDKVLEVINRYRPDEVYFDSRANLIPDIYKQQICDALYRNPDTLITYKQHDFPEGTAVVDIECGRFSDTKDYPWQVDDKLEDFASWCYNPDPIYKSPTRIIHQLCDIVSKNGNLLLNVGPKADGTFDERAVKTLSKIGDWLRICGEAIYGTRPFAIAQEGPTVMKDNNYDVKKISAQIEKGYMMEETIPDFTSEDIRFTKKGDTVYAIAMDWPRDGRFLIKSLGLKGPKGRIASVSMVGNDGKIQWVQQEDGLVIDCAMDKPYEHAFAFRID